MFKEILEEETKFSVKWVKSLEDLFKWKFIYNL